MKMIALWLGLAWAVALHAEVVLPQGDAEIVETLPSALGDRAEERKWRRQWANDPRNPELAVALARRYLAQARAQGEPRWAGRALATLRAWPDPERAPDDVLLTLATLQQFLHDFDASAQNLQRLVQRQPRHAQAWLTLATIRRVQGRYAESDLACRALAGMTDAALYAQACAAENAGLRGDFAQARAALRRLVAAPHLSEATRSWLFTTLAETESRAGNRNDAEQAYRAALRLQPDEYTRLSFADFLMQAQRHADALPMLESMPRTDAVLLRLAMAGAQLKSSQGERDAQEMRNRFRQAELRPQSRPWHAREQAMFALVVDKQAERALEFARSNVAQQAEPMDVLLLAQAAHAAGRADALRQAAQLRDRMGLKDARLDALL
jgi:tetratricopeptide (TPR) repeat protein